MRIRKGTELFKLRKQKSHIFTALENDAFVILMQRFVSTPMWRHCLEHSVFLAQKKNNKCTFMGWKLPTMKPNFRVIPNKNRPVRVVNMDAHGSQLKKKNNRLPRAASRDPVKFIVAKEQPRYNVSQ